MTITMELTLSLFGVLILILIGAKLVASRVFSKEVAQLFMESPNEVVQYVQYDQLKRLPEPVQRYFKHVLKENQPYINYARITHDGKFKTGLDKGWINIKGEQYATTQKPGFIWKGTTFMFTARDMYIADKGRLVVSLFSLYTIVDATGDTYNQGELLRWLGESVLYPTNLLPSDKLHWEAINSNSARLNFQYKGMSLFFIITINEAGEITEMETKRYMDETRLESWVIKCSGYKEMNEVIVPTRFDVAWRLEKGDFSYADFIIRRIEYNIPKQF